MSKPHFLALYWLTGAFWILSPPTQFVSAFWKSTQVAATPVSERFCQPCKDGVYAQQPATLRAADLPSGFQEVPPMFKSLLLERVSGTNSYLKQQGILVKDSFALLNFTDFTIVLGFITSLPTSDAMHRFDDGLRRPDALQEFTAAMKDSLNFLGPVTVKQQNLISNLPNSIGEVATGWAVVGDAGPFPVFADMVMFRRGKLGALTVVGSLNRKSQLVSAPEVAKKIDTRLQNAGALTISPTLLRAGDTNQLYSLIPGGTLPGQ